MKPVWKQHLLILLASILVAVTPALAEDAPSHEDRIASKCLAYDDAALERTAAKIDSYIANLPVIPSAEEKYFMAEEKHFMAESNRISGGSSEAVLIALEAHRFYAAWNAKQALYKLSDLSRILLANDFKSVPSMFRTPEARKLEIALTAVIPASASAVSVQDLMSQERNRADSVITKQQAKVLRDVSFLPVFFELYSKCQLARLPVN
jgi:hypothetical protein